jgi:tetratricopeptide (TPR) repeat protein
LRLLNGQAWAQLRSGDIDTALSSLERAQKLVEAPDCTNLDRAEVIFRVGVCRYSRSEIPEAIKLFTQALALADRSASDRLRVDILGWRSRCYRRERDWVAAWEDIERALELADASSNLQQLAETYFQASLVTHRQGRWLLARTYAERAKSAFEQVGDRATAARVLNNIAGLDHLLGDPARAIARLQEAFSIFVEEGLAVEAGYVLSSQADIHLGLSEFEKAEEQARKALKLLGDRLDHLQEIGTAQLALGRALAGQDRINEAEETIAAAQRTVEQARSISHQADASIARGDLETRRGNDRTAAAHFRQAVEALRETDIDHNSDMFFSTR